MVKNGIDVLLTTPEYRKLLNGKRVGLLTTPAAVTNQFESTVDVLVREFNVTAFFSPEHGIRGDRDAGDLVDGYVDEQTGIYVHSLYRKDGKRLLKSMLDDIDVMVIDLQDVGTRYYTFLYTMLYALEDLGAAGIGAIVLDRINPLGGTIVEGNCLKPGFESFVGDYPLCMRYGLTIGELALMAKSERKLSVELHMIPLEGWNRNMLYPELHRPFIMPSLGLPRFESALLYPGMCLFEGTNISEGRGTSAPFEMIGAPFLNAARLCDEFKALKLPGITARCAYFTPTSSKHKGIACQGIQLLIIDYYAVRPVTAGLALLDLIKCQAGDKFEFLPPLNETSKPMIDLLSGDSAIRCNTYSFKELRKQYEADCLSFTRRSKEYRLYTREVVK